MALPTPSFNDILAIGQSKAQEVRPSLAFAPGDQGTAMARAGSAMFDHCVGWMADQIRQMFFGGAVGDELDTVIMDRLQLPRTPATAAYGSITFARAGSGKAGVIGSGNQEATPPDATGASSTYLTDHDLSYPNTNFSLTVPATCATAGVAGNLDAVTSDPTLLALSIVDALDDSSITATANGFAGGNDVESDEHYMSRAVNLSLTQRGATLAALEEGALGVGGVAVAHAVEDEDTGLVTVRVADSVGGSTGEMEASANAELKGWRAAGVNVAAKGMHPSVLDLTISIVDYADGFDVQAASPTMTDAVTARLAGLRPGETLYLDEIRAACIAPYATQIYKIAFASIALDGAAAIDLTADITPDNGREIHLRSVTFSDGKTATP
jgi:uncharacterized phage protein gp47/JayE